MAMALLYSICVKDPHRHQQLQDDLAPFLQVFVYVFARIDPLYCRQLQVWKPVGAWSSHSTEHFEISKPLQNKCFRSCMPYVWLGSH